MIRRTKILATLGPASDSKEVLMAMMKAGLNAVRCNFSHGTPEDHEKRLGMIREAASELGIFVGILADLQGPKIRISTFKTGQVELIPGAKFILDAAHPKGEGTLERVGIDYKDLPKDVKAGDILLLGDGNLELEVLKTAGTEIICQVLAGGVLSNNKGINKKGGGLSAKALTDKDKEDIKTAARLGVDYVAVSFPRDASDMQEARALLKAAGSSACLVAKIERVEAVKNIDEIIRVSDAVMVARGDLAVEIGDAEVPAVQKMMIERARMMDKIVITATQMMESMIQSPSPTRAEVSDVANAVLDGTDAVMLSAETAVGKYPVKVIEAVDRVCKAAERYPINPVTRKREDRHFRRVDESISMGAMFIANHLDLQAVIALTESGNTALWMSRINAHLPIFALTQNAMTQGKMTLCRGVIPVHFAARAEPEDCVNEGAIATLLRLNWLKKGASVLITSGDQVGCHGGTNTLKILTV